MNWWSILKVIRPLDDPQAAEAERQRQAKFSEQDTFEIEQPITARKPIDKTPQYDPTKSPQEYINQPIESDTAVGNQQVQAGQGGQTNVNQFVTPPQLGGSVQTNTQVDSSGVSASGADDSDVGETRQNVQDAKVNLNQLPRGPFAAQVTEALKLLSEAAIDPVKQKDIAIEAKKKLHAIFPSSMA